MATLSFCKNSDFGNNLLIGALGALSQQYLGDIKTVPNILCAALTFSAVVAQKPRVNQGINYIAKATLSLYVIHQVPLFLPFLWEKVFLGSRWIPLHPFAYVFVVFFSLLIMAVILDEFRRRFVEPFWVNSKLFSKAENG